LRGEAFGGWGKDTKLTRKTVLRKKHRKRQISFDRFELAGKQSFQLDSNVLPTQLKGAKGKSTAVSKKLLSLTDVLIC
jgi:hypothetical protein